MLTVSRFDSIKHGRKARRGLLHPFDCDCGSGLRPLADLMASCPYKKAAAEFQTETPNSTPCVRDWPASLGGDPARRRSEPSQICAGKSPQAPGLPYLYLLSSLNLSSSPKVAIRAPTSTGTDRPRTNFTSNKQR